MRGRWVVAAMVMVILLVGSTPARADLTPLVVGWERHFTLSWDSWDKAGRIEVGGYIANESGFTAMKVALLVEGLDDSGGIQTQELSWLGSTLTPGTRAYFAVPVRQRSPHYRVRVFAYDWLQVSLQMP